MFSTILCYNAPSGAGFLHLLEELKIDVMDKNLDIINAAVSLINKAALLAARFSGRVRKRSLKRLAAMDVHDKDKEIIFLRDKVDQLSLALLVLAERFAVARLSRRSVSGGAFQTRHKGFSVRIQPFLPNRASTE